MNMMPAPIQWIIARPAEDQTWWVQETSEGPCRNGEVRGILDPRQIADLAVRVAQYLPYGLISDEVDAAFQRFIAASELSDGGMRLTPTAQSFLDADSGLFALPILDEEGDGPFCDFLDSLSTARIRLLNATHRYARQCSELEMIEELDALEQDRYLSAETIHAFDEIDEILQWSPAEWDER